VQAKSLQDLITKGIRKIRRWILDKTQHWRMNESLCLGSCYGCFSVCSSTPDTFPPWSPAPHTICCGYYSIDTQERFSYTPFIKKEAFIKIDRA